jgi:L-alanine-DL-glutamate epimerase-like enolase superfamily enzyme
MTAQANKGKGADTLLKSLEVSAYRVPTDRPEADGTYEWESTTMVVVEATAANLRGVGYTYANTATARLIHDRFRNLLESQKVMSVTEAWAVMIRDVRNLGRPGIAAMAISAVDAALWDLKARVLGLPLVSLLGQVRTSVPVYGSGGFTSYSIDQLQKQLAGWVAQGIHRVKMKIGTHPADDLRRVAAAREAIGPHVELFVDANGAYSRKQALQFAEAFTAFDVKWFEEPVSSDDLEGLRLIRDRAPAGMEIAAGEYGYDHFYFKRMIDAGAVDVLQADATRCLGITGLMRAAALCEAANLPLSAHCGPAQHAHPCAALLPLRHIEYFHDHARIEPMFFDGALAPVDGALMPDRSRTGNGLAFKPQDAARFAV